MDFSKYVGTIKAPDSSTKYFYTITGIDGHVFYDSARFENLPANIKKLVKYGAPSTVNVLYKIERIPNPEYKDILNKRLEEEIKLRKQFLDDMAEEFNYVKHRNRVKVEDRMHRLIGTSDNTMLEKYEFIMAWHDLLFD